MCGSCYAFAAIAGAETAYAIKTGQLYKFSEQHVTDCLNDIGTGCAGSTYEKALPFLAYNGCILSSDYPYENGQSNVSSECQQLGKTVY